MEVLCACTADTYYGELSEKESTEKCADANKVIDAVNAEKKKAVMAAAREKAKTSLEARKAKRSLRFAAE